AKRDIGRLVELIVAGARLVTRPQGQKKLPRRTEFQDEMMPGVGRPDVVVAVDANAVRRLDQIIPPAANELAVTVEAEDRRFPAMEKIDLIVAVDRDSRALAERHARRR